MYIKAFPLMYDFLKTELEPASSYTSKSIRSPLILASVSATTPSI
nr:MAG TPA: hypothetical protein [Bacteriophage sp.]